MFSLEAGVSLRLGLSILGGIGVVLFAGRASADIEIDAPLVVIDFSSFEGLGFAPNPAAGQLDSDDWAITLGDGIALDFGGIAEDPSGSFARGVSTGSVDDSGIFAFDVDGAGRIGLGVQPTGSIFTPGRISLRLVNDAGYELTEFQVEYTIWVRNDAMRASTFDLEQSADHAVYTQVGAGFTTPGAPDANGFTPTDVVELVTTVEPISDGGQYYLGWSGDDAELKGSGSRDEIAIDGITIRLLHACGNGLVEDDEACDDENTEDGDGCSAACSVEEASTTSSGGDTTAGESGDDADTSGGGDTDVTATGASTSASTSTTDPTGASATTATGSDTTATATDTGESDGGSSSEDDETSGCSCTASRTGAQGTGLLALMALGVARRRRR